MSYTYYLWVDIECTRLPFEGYLPVKADILEISFILTDPSVNVIFSEHFILNNNLKNINEFSKVTHSKNGLLDEIVLSENTVMNIENVILSKLENLNGSIILAGSTLYSDKEILRRSFPNLYKKLHYQVLDIASIRIALESIDKTKIKKLNQLLKTQHGKVLHRSHEDLMRILTEYRYYLKYFKGLV